MNVVLRKYVAATTMLAMVLVICARAGESRQNVLNLYAWAEYFPRSVVSKFQAETAADSPNYAGALRFINFMMRPEISAEVTRFIGFASGNAAAVPLLEPAVRDNVIVYPPAAIRARFATDHVYSTDEMRIYTRAWQRFSTGQ